jgi:hypothetical protein
MKSILDPSFNSSGTPAVVLQRTARADRRPALAGDGLRRLARQPRARRIAWSVACLSVRVKLRDLYELLPQPKDDE